MISNIKIVALVVAASFALIFEAGLATGEELPIDIKETLGLAVHETQQPFENKIKELLSVSKNDINRGGFGDRKINFQERKHLFIPSAWDAYTNFIAKRRKTLDARSERHLNSVAEFKYGTQKYSKNDVSAEFFSVHGVYYYSEYDSYGPGETFHLQIQFRLKDWKELSDLSIIKWDVIPGERNNGSAD